MTLILVVFLGLLMVACSADIGNNGGGNQDNDNTEIDIDLDYNNDGKVDDDDMAANCISCILDKPEDQECSCLEDLGCEEEDLADCLECDGQLALCLGELVVDLDGGAL